MKKPAPGDRFNHLTLVRLVGNAEYGRIGNRVLRHPTALWRCDCGAEKVIPVHRVVAVQEGGREMTIYTVSSTDDIMREPLSSLVIGSYTTRGKALDECVAYVMERLSVRQDLAWALLHDENHPEAQKFFVEHKDGRVGVRRGCLNKWKAYLRDELGGQGCYYVYDGADCIFHFDVDENDLCGDCWHLVTWGDSDIEDPNFTTPFPELFTDEDKAVANAVQYAKDLMESHDFGPEDQDRNILYLKDALREDGQARLDLNDGTAVHWVLYHFGMETENTDGK